MTPLARQEHSRSLEELRERAWSLSWPIVEAAALVENKVGLSQRENAPTVSWKNILGKEESAGGVRD